MSLAADALQPFITRGLFVLSGRSVHSHLTDLIISSRQSGFDLDFSDIDLSIKVDFRDSDYLAAAIGGDACRLASAAFTTLSNIGDEIANGHNIAWSLVKLYYAAFYAGHSLLRLLGHSCSYLDSSHITRIRQLASAFGNTPGFPINAGMYHGVLTAGQTGIDFIASGRATGGSHEVFWHIFSSYLRSLTEQVLLGHLTPRDAKMVFQQLTALETILTSARANSWLSTFRNDV